MTDKQEWEKLRQAVSDQQEITSTEWRINNLERRFNVMESSVIKQLEQLTGAYQHVASAMDRMVERHEFVPIKNLVFALCACLVTGVVAALFTRVFMR